MSAVAPATHREIIASQQRCRTQIPPLLVATALALLLHLAATLAVAVLDPPNHGDSADGKTATAPLRFDLLPTPRPASDEPTEAESTPETPLELPTEPVADPEPAPVPEPVPEPDQASPLLEPTLAETSSDPAQFQQQDRSQELELAPEQDRAPEQPSTASFVDTETIPAALNEPTPATDSLSAPAARQISAADILASRDQMLASLNQPRSPTRTGAAQRRRKAINASTQEYIYANYLESWRRKVERIGNLNYPQEAKEKHLFGSLVLHVAVRADGSLEGVRVLRSSGHQVLDQAAVRIVELAAPFAPFPENIRKHHDVLDITRTWQFLREQTLGWDK